LLAGGPVKKIKLNLVHFSACQLHFVHKCVSFLISFWHFCFSTI